MADQIQLRGLRVLAHCGATPEERDRLQPFEIDIDIESDQRSAGTSDDLSDTVDYEAQCDAILEIVKVEQFSLMERLAQRTVDEILGLDQSIEAVTVSVQKLRPPVQADLASAAVKIRRIRE